MKFEITDGYLKKYLGDDPVVVIPDGVTEISSRAFWARDDISEITFPESVVKVSSYTFAECKGLKKINILGSPILGNGAFYRCENLRELNVSGSIENFKTGAFAGCLNLESAELSGKTFELYTLTDNRPLDKIRYLEDADMAKKTYSFEEYKKIMAETMDHVLIYSKEHYDELLGPETPETEEYNEPITDDIVVVKDGHFVGCALEKRYVGNIKDYKKTLVLLKPGDGSINLRSQSGASLPHYAYVYEEAFFRSRDGREGWIGRANSGHTLK